MEKLLSLIVSFLLILGQRLAEGCSCMPAHPQQYYCWADYAIKAVILSQESEGDLRGRGNIIFQAQVEEVFKSNDDQIKPGAIVAIETAGNGAMCGIGLTDGETYFITGSSSNKLRVGLCDWVEPWASVSASQKTALRYFYKLSCNECQVKTQYSFYQPLPQSKFCRSDITWNMQTGKMDSCEVKYSTCMHVTSPDTCEWLTTSAYADCIRKRDGVPEEASGLTFPW